MTDFPPPSPEPCPFFRCWIGPCKQTDRSKCKHPTTGVCRCGRPAISECEMASSFVCGELICHTGMCARHGGRCAR